MIATLKDTNSQANTTLILPIKLKFIKSSNQMTVRSNFPYQAINEGQTLDILRECNPKGRE